MTGIFQERKSKVDYLKKLKRAISRENETVSSQANGILSVIDQAPSERRFALFKFLLRYFRCTFSLENPDEEKRSEGKINEQVWNANRSRPSSVIDSFITATHKENPPFNTVAEWLWHFLEELQGDERTVALALLLMSPIVPYAQVPTDLLSSPLAGEEVFRQKVIALASQLTIVRRLATGPFLPNQKMSGMARLLARTNDPVSSYLLLEAILTEHTQVVGEAAVVQATRAMSDEKAVIH